MQESDADGLPWEADPRASTPGGDVPTWPSSPDAVFSAAASVQGCRRCYDHRGDASCRGSESQNDCFCGPRCIDQCRFHYYSSLAFTPRLRADFPERGELSWGALPPGDPWQCLETFWVSESDRGLWALPCRGWESGRTPCDASGSPQQGTIWSRVEMGCWLAGEAGPGSLVLSGHLGRTSGLLLSFATSCCVLMVHFMCQSARVLGGPVADRLCFWACPEEVKIRSSGLSGGGGLASGWQRTGRSALLDTHLLPLDMASLVLSPPGLGLQLANPGSAQSA